jgi:hypothetical protein
MSTRHRVEKLASCQELSKPLCAMVREKRCLIQSLALTSGSVGGSGIDVPITSSHQVEKAFVIAKFKDALVVI